jgi:S-adenosylmethionine decarboxylase
MTISAPLPYEGRHLIADLHGCSGLDDVERVRAALLGGAAAAGAHVLETRLHAFGPGQGITGFALLAESHISIHSWPEHGYAAIDIFMCGRSHDLDRALAAVTAALGASNVVTHDISRGYCAAVAVTPGSQSRENLRLRC